MPSSPSRLPARLTQDPARLSPVAILRLAGAAVRELDACRKALQLATSTDGFEIGLRPLDDFILTFTSALGICELVFDSGPSVPRRLAVRLAQQRLGAAQARLALDPAIQAATRDRIAALSGQALEADERRFLERVSEDLARSDHEAEQEPVISSELEGIAARFLANAGRVDGEIAASPIAVASLPPSLRRLMTPAGTDRWRVSATPDDALALLSELPDRQARADLELLYLNRGAQANEPLLRRALSLRRRLAVGSGYSSFAQMTMARQSHGTPDELRALYARLREALLPLLAAEERELGEAIALEEGQAVELASYDLLHGLALRRAALHLDEGAFSAYFPVEPTLSALLAEAGRLFGLRFIPETLGDGQAGVAIFTVADADGVPAGQLYVDLYARPGKTTQPQTSCLRPARRGAPGRADSLAIWAISTPFAPPVDQSPALLRPDELRTLCHELGHAIHGLTMRSRFAIFNLYDAERAGEWVEAPSQVFERMATDEGVLRRLGRHHVDGATLPEHLAARAARAARLGGAVRATRQMYMGLLDQLLHGAEDIEPGEADVLAAEAAGALRRTGASPATSFTHLFGGYAGIYYGYLWAEIRAAEIWAALRRQGVLEPKGWGELRMQILAPGWSREPEDSLCQFLGRPPDERAWLAEIAGND